MLSITVKNKYRNPYDLKRHSDLHLEKVKEEKAETPIKNNRN